MYSAKAHQLVRKFATPKKAKAKICAAATNSRRRSATSFQPEIAPRAPLLKEAPISADALTKSASPANSESNKLLRYIFILLLCLSLFIYDLNDWGFGNYHLDNFSI